MNLGGMILLQELGFLTREKNRLLDIGPQNVYELSPEQIDTFVRNQGLEVPPERYKRERERLIYFSTPRPEERTTLFSEIADLTNIEYNSFDVCPALKTEILDLNFEVLPAKDAEYYDVVLNFGTTEHVFNQWNSFEVMHDATRVGGVIYHQLPASGYLDHGYYCYTPLFFQELAKANKYEICTMFVTPAGENSLAAMGLDVKQHNGRLGVPVLLGLAAVPSRVPCFNIHAILKKTESARFRTGLEIATAHASVDPRILELYRIKSTAHLNSLGHEKIIMEIVRDRENKIAVLQAKHKERIDETVQSYEERIAETARSYEERIAETVQSYEERLAETAQSYEGRIAEIAGDLDNTIAGLQTQHKERIDKTVHNYEERIDETVHSYEERVDETVHSYEERIDEMAHSYEERIDETVHSYEERIDETVHSYEERMAETAGSYEERIAGAVQSYEAKLGAVVAEREQTIATFKNTMSWRITAPLRTVSALFGRVSPGAGGLREP